MKLVVLIVSIVLISVNVENIIANLIPSTFSGGSDTSTITKISTNQSSVRLASADEYSSAERRDCAGPGSECLPFYRCKKQNTIGLSSKLYPCDGFSEICCAKENQIGCGYRNKNGIGYGIQKDPDSATKHGEFPWMTGILKEERLAHQTLNVFQCGGSLIHPEVVMTAAHCVYGKAIDSLKVRVGEWDSQQMNELRPHQDRHVNEVVTHGNFCQGTLHYDIALVFLASPVVFDENVNTICLPDAKTTFDFTKCLITGWGKDTADGKHHDILRKIDVNVVPQRQCENSLRSTRLGEQFELHRSFICAKAEAEKDTCKGDGGSPMICPVEGQVNVYLQAGINSWGIGCGNSFPSVYTSVPEFRDWIDMQLESRKMNSSFYTV